MIGFLHLSYSSHFLHPHLPFYPSKHKNKLWFQPSNLPPGFNLDSWLFYSKDQFWRVELNFSYVNFYFQWLWFYTYWGTMHKKNIKVPKIMWEEDGLTNTNLLNWLPSIRNSNKWPFKILSSFYHCVNSFQHITLSIWVHMLLQSWICFMSNNQWPSVD